MCNYYVHKLTLLLIYNLIQSIKEKELNLILPQPKKY